MADIYSKVKIPASTQERLIARRCDSCGEKTTNAPSPDHVNWAKMPGYFDHITVRRHHGHITEQSERSCTIEYHLCGLCFEALIDDVLTKSKVPKIQKIKTDKTNSEPMTTYVEDV
jgi:formate dehydrogenase assembly factor FdhD